MCMSEDSIPVISQIKSLILLLRGDKFGASETQRAFICQCIVISQVYSLFKYLYEKDFESAMEIQFEFYRSTFVAVPLVSQLLSIFLSNIFESNQFRLFFPPSPYSSSSLMIIPQKKKRTKFECLCFFFSSKKKKKNVSQGDLIFFPVRFFMYLFHPWPRILRPLHSLHPIKNKIKKKIRKKSQKWLRFLNLSEDNLKKEDKHAKKEVHGQMPLKCWMKQFEQFPLSYLTLPGTHNAHAYKFKWVVSFLSNFAVNQHWDVYRQLKNGARCLDIRVGTLIKKKKKNNF
ncbi:hypothetical protein RFI_17129 [Reticulomyxa filosa]|uniref:Phosphatidylinositol-specific phospholipase C X domain-containing protein n=1 Tax=Reticulomyxa filosa TaxID=46433 RepID=X6N2X3_RETFI|nr:hypothetical protein RFI_17129 [Reticulomyxa filosa]|eukprot:ETO20089.1 hypothetical protein RFI_17129 [Reticulomyxa filosa]